MAREKKVAPSDKEKESVRDDKTWVKERMERENVWEKDNQTDQKKELDNGMSP